jgi:hypothetical protein
MRYGKCNFGLFLFFSLCCNSILLISHIQIWNVNNATLENLTGKVKEDVFTQINPIHNSNFSDRVNGN